MKNIKEDKMKLFELNEAFKLFYLNNTKPEIQNHVIFKITNVDKQEDYSFLNETARRHVDDGTNIYYRSYKITNYEYFRIITDEDEIIFKSCSYLPSGEKAFKIEDAIDIINKFIDNETDEKIVVEIPMKVIEYNYYDNIISSAEKFIDDLLDSLTNLNL